MVSTLNTLVIVLLVLIVVGFILLIGITIAMYKNKMGKATFAIMLVLSIFLMFYSLLILYNTSLSGKSSEVYTDLIKEGYVEKNMVTLNKFKFTTENKDVYISTKIDDVSYKFKVTEDSLIVNDTVATTPTNVLIEEVVLTKDLPKPMGTVLNLVNTANKKGDIANIELKSITKGQDFPK